MSPSCKRAVCALVPLKTSLTSKVSVAVPFVCKKDYEEPYPFLAYVAIFYGSTKYHFALLVSVLYGKWLCATRIGKRVRKEQRE